MRTHRFFEGLRPTLHIAHRGGAALAPENTRPAFEAAVTRWRTDMIETDVQPTRDGELAVFHDETVDRCTDGAGRVADLTFDELARLDAGFRFTRDDGRTFPYRGRGVRAMRLAELLRAFPDLPLNIELKSDRPDVERAFADVLRAEGALGRVTIGCAEDPALSDRLCAVLPEACHFAPAPYLLQFFAAVRQGVAPPVDPRYHVLDLPLDWEGLRVVDPALLAAARAAGLWVNVWTVDAPEDMRALVAMGAGGVMTDRPDLLRAVLDDAAVPA